MEEEVKNNCVDCGKHRSELTEIPWGWGKGIICKPCRQLRVDKQIEEFQAKEEDTDFEDEITCPYCGDKNGDSWEVSEDSGEDTCGNCGNEFHFERDITVTYSTKKKSI
jgi:DNA-directed RNA polymerase subunit RPC12/RpoP